MTKPLVTDIQKYCIQDGTGIRTTIFFKGCPLACAWCHNPETQAYNSQILYQEEQCTGCGSCISVCPMNAIGIEEGKARTDYKLCRQCGTCLDYCYTNSRELVGKHYTVDELINEIEKDRIFYEQSKGGVTLSGGEVLAQDIDYLEDLLRKLDQKGYRVNLDTCGYAPFDKIKRIMKYVDTFLYDIKCIDPILHKEFTGVDNSLILENLKLLSREKAILWIRIPVIGGVNNTDYHMEQIAEYLKIEKIHIKQINLLPYHNTGNSKYNRLQEIYKGESFISPTKTELERYIFLFKQKGFDHIKIGG